MRQAARFFIRQTIALYTTELIRQGCSTAYATLIILWTLVCGLFFQVVVSYATNHELPLGETPMSFFFRASPLLLPLLLIVFVPHLSMDAIAGRKENGRLEHLFICGVHPLALLTGAWAATCTLLLALLIPPICFHVFLSIHGTADFGRTLSALLSLCAQSFSIAALGYACSSIMNNKQSAGLLALGLGLTWWVIDAFGHVFESSLTIVRDVLPLTAFVYDSAFGLLSGSSLLAHGIIVLLFLFLAHTVLSPRHQKRIKIINSGLALLLAGLVLTSSSQCTAHSDFTSTQEHALAPQTQQLLRELQPSGISATLVTTPHMLHDPIDGGIINATQHSLSLMKTYGLTVHELDPGLDPAGAAKLGNDLQISADDWQRPLLLLRHSGSYEIIPADELGIVTERDGQRLLAAVQVEGSVLAALQRFLQPQQIQVAWYVGADARPLGDIHTNNPRCLGRFHRLCAQAGLSLTLSPEWETLFTCDPRVIMLLGIHADPPAEIIQQLDRFLNNGGRLCLGLDGIHPQRLPKLAQLLGRYGIHWSDAQLVFPASTQSGEQVFLSSQEIPALSNTGPSAFATAEQHAIFADHLVALQATRGEFKSLSLFPQLALAEGAFLKRDGQLPTASNSQLYSLVAAGSEKSHKLCRITVLASVDMLSDEHLSVSGNRLLATGLVHWLAHEKRSALLPPKAVEQTRYLLHDGERAFLIWGIGLGLPGFSFLCMGYIVWRRRRTV